VREEAVPPWACVRRSPGDARLVDAEAGAQGDGGGASAGLDTVDVDVE
jgi:hypothetical protein